MTRENLLQAIYDNEDDWSCQYTCPHTMEEENPQDVCMKCAEKQLKDYEDKIRAEVEQETYERAYKEGYEKGDSDGRFFERVELQKAFELLHGSEYSWQEVCDKADMLIKEQNNE